MELRGIHRPKVRRRERDGVPAQGIDDTSAQRGLGDHGQHKGIEIAIRMKPAAHFLERLNLAERWKSPLRGRYGREAGGLIRDPKTAGAAEINENPLQGRNGSFRLIESYAFQAAKAINLGAEFGFMHALKLGCIQPGDEDLHHGARRMLQVGRNSAIAGHMGGINNFIVVKPGQCGGNFIATGGCGQIFGARPGSGIGGIFARQLLRRPVRAVGDNRRAAFETVGGPAGGRREIRFAAVKTVGRRRRLIRIAFGKPKPRRLTAR